MSKRYPPVIVATCLVPWDERYQVDERLFRAQVRLLRERLTPHLYIFGSAGEGYAVSDRQFDWIVRLFAEETRGDCHPMVGLISLSLSTVIERLERCLELGFQTFQISLPSWGALNDAELTRFFGETCGRFPQARFLHYNLPRAKRLLTGADYARLAEAHPNLVAVKTGGPDRQFLADLLTQAPDLQFFFTEQNYAAVRDEFECGLLISIATCNPERGKRFHAARGAELAALRDELGEFIRSLMADVGPDRHMDGAYDKLFTKLHIPEFPLRLLPPYAGSDETVFAQFRAHMPAVWRPDEGVRDASGRPGNDLR